MSSFPTMRPSRRVWSELSIKGIIFDLDGTLADTMPVCLEAYRRTFLRHTGRSFSDEEIFGLYGPNDEGILQRALGDDWEAGLTTFLAEYRTEHERCPSAFPGIVDILGKLKEHGILLGVATGKGIHSARLSLDFLGLTPYFDVLETGSEKGGIKPQMIRNILATWHLSTSEVAYVGDWPSDVDGSKDAGVIPLSAGWAAGSDLDAMIAQGPEAAFATVEEFAEWVVKRVFGEG